MFEITKNGKGTALYFQDKKDALMFCVRKTLAQVGGLLGVDWDVQEVQHGA